VVVEVVVLVLEDQVEVHQLVLVLEELDQMDLEVLQPLIKVVVEALELVVNVLQAEQVALE
jgi:hypothetical protein